MDIENLKELQIAKQVLILNKSAVQYDLAPSKEDQEFIDAVEIAVSLIDEAIARQSVTSEEVAEAITQLEIMATNMMGEIQNGNPLAEMNIKAIDLAIAALQEYQPWVSVADRLPESDDGHQNLVLVLDIGGNYEIEMPSHIIRNIEDYTHWKPLPEPPKGE